MGGMRMNPRQMQKAMKQMGIKQNSLEDVTEVIIRTRTNEIVLKGADVICVEMGGQKSYQVSGPETVRPLGGSEEGSSEPEVTFAASDVDLVMSQTGCNREKAIAALTATDGQPAEAILKIMTE